MEITLEKSQALADAINKIKFFLPEIDLEYAKEVYVAMLNDANRQDSLAALSSRYDPAKTDLMKMQASMLNHLIFFIEKGMEIDKQKEKVRQNTSARASIDALFS